MDDLVKRNTKTLDPRLLTNMVPISRGIFQKMVFCDQIFQFIELEESLCFTAIDVEFHSFDASKDNAKEITKQDLLDINYKHLSALSVNQK